MRTVGVCSALVFLIVALHALGRAGLRGPTGFSMSELTAWLDDPVEVIATVARWVALVLSYYLVAIVLVIAALGDNFEQSLVQHIVPRQISGLVGLILGVSAVAVPLSMHMVQTDTATTTTPTEELSLSPLDEPLTLTSNGTAPHAGGFDDLSPNLGRAPASGRQFETWIVAPGDSFWSIAEEQLVDTWGRGDLTNNEIASYWRTLIDANVDRLVEPGNPDLLLPNQELLLPRTPPPQR